MTERGREALVVRTAACTTSLSMLCWLVGCAATPAPAVTPVDGPAAGVHAASGRAKAPDAIAVPSTPERALRLRTRVATGLENPRGMRVLPDGRLLVAEAGTGDPATLMSGKLSRLSDTDGDGLFLAKVDQSEVLLKEQPSRNILDIVRRDEVFGMAGMDAGPEGVLVALAFFGGPSTVFAVHGDVVEPWGSTHLNINDLTYDARRKAWFAVGSTTNEVVRLLPGRGTERVLSIPPLSNGQDAVPGYLISDPRTGELLVSLFTGSTEGEEGGEGVELIAGAGGIIRVDPDSGAFQWAVTGLSAPTDLTVGPDASLYVLEFCDAFLDPVPTREAMWNRPSHGGFRRFSGRLLRIDRDARRVEVIAEGLDAPTNLEIFQDTLYIAQGMGTPGRPIPGPEGAIELEGFIERVSLTDTP